MTTITVETSLWDIESIRGAAVSQALVAGGHTSGMDGWRINIDAVGMSVELQELVLSGNVWEEVGSPIPFEVILV